MINLGAMALRQDTPGYAEAFGRKYLTSATLPVSRSGCICAGLPRGRARLWPAVLLCIPIFAQAADLTLSDGVVVKFGGDAELISRDTLRTEGQVVFTSLHDSTVGGATLVNGPAPQPGDWKGIELAPGALVADTRLDNAEIRYAGAGQAGGGLRFSRLAYTFENLRLWRNTIGIRASLGGVAAIAESRFAENGIGVIADTGATPHIVASELFTNTTLGVQNLAPVNVLLARGNWWGHPSGPADPIANPAGQGDAVTAGVDYGQFLTAPPLLRCTVRAADHVYNVIRRTVTVALACRNAIEYRLSESTAFSEPFAPMASTGTFRLSPSPGSKTVYAEYRGALGQTRVVQIPQPFVYTPTTPLVTFQAPAANAALSENTTIRVTATDPLGIVGVEFRANDWVLGSDNEAPYEWPWDISAIPDGPYTLTAIATNSDERSGQTSRQVRIERLEPQPDSYTFPEGEVLFVGAPGLLANDQTGTGATIEVTQQPSWGVLNVANDGSFVYRPDTTDRNGTTTFRYRLRLGAQASPAVAVTLNVTAVNDSPEARDDLYLTDENVGLDIAAPGVLENDTDVDSAGLIAELVVGPTRGTLLLRANGSFNYVPEVNFVGQDEFFYRVRDPEGAIAQATVILNVTQPPTATNDVYLLDVNQFLEVLDAQQGIIANDLDPPEDDPLTALLVTPPANGTLILQTNGTFTYRPNSDFQGLDPFTYRVTDGRSSSNLATVTLAVGVTGLPRGVNDAYQGTEDQELVVNAANGVLANDTDADTPREELEVFLVAYDSSFPDGAFTDRNQITLNLDGSFSVRPRANFNGPTWFLYEIYDGTSRSNATRVDLDIQRVNDGVMAEDDVYGTRRNELLRVPSAGRNHINRNDRYDDDFAVAYETVGTPPIGTVTWGAGGSFTYAPPQDFAGFDEFTYRVYQVETGIADTALVRIRTNAPPVGVADVYTVDEDTVTIVTPSVLTNDSDPDGDPIRTTSLGVGGRDSFYAQVSWNDAANPTQTRIETRFHFYGTLQAMWYSVTDGIDTTLVPVTVQVRPIPDAPIAAADNYLTQRNTTLTISDPAQGIFRNDHDPDARSGPSAAPWVGVQPIDLLPWTMRLLQTTAHGTLTLNNDGTFAYVPKTGYSGIDEFRYELTDATGLTSTPAVVRIRVNTPPTTATDNYSLDEDTVLVVPAAQGVLVNDADIDGDTLFASARIIQPCAPCRGRVTVRFDGGFTYTPDANDFGSDSFGYWATDPFQTSSTGHVNLTILPVNDAPISEPDSYRIDEDTVLLAAAALGVLRNDEEVDGEDLINATLVRAPQHGAVVLENDGGLSYTPNENYNGIDTFRYRVYDESNLWDESDVTIIIDPVNDAPIAVDDSYNVDQDRTLTVSAAQGVLVNDRDVDGPGLTAALTTPPQHGSVSLAASGGFTYQPNGVFSGIDRFQYQVSDGLDGVSSATVVINVRNVTSPVEITVVDDVYTVDGASFVAAAPGVLANDSVTNGPPLTAALVSAPDRGTVTLNADGAFEYAAPANYQGTTTFTYAASSDGVSELGLVTLHVDNLGNQPPVAVGEQFGVLEDQVLDSRSAGGLLGNDDDPEGAPLRFVLVQSPVHGVLEAEVDGEFSYTPAPNFHGTDPFRYRVSDGELLSNTVVAAITVFPQNDAPVAIDDSYQVQRDQTLSVPAPGVLGNDSDVDGDALSVELVDAPLHGQLQMAANGGFSYQPLPGFTGADRFRYAVTDGSARDVSQVTVQVTAPGNRPPLAVGESYTLSEDAPLASGGAVPGLLANDSDPDGDLLQVQIVTPPTHGELLIDGANFRYTPDADYFGSDQFSYRVYDGALHSEAVVTTLTILSVNDAPLAETDLYLTTQGTALNVSAAQGVLANDSDAEGDPLSASMATEPAHGQVNLAASGAFIYTPNASFFGRDEFEYRVSDGNAHAIGRVAIDVTRAANQRPIAVGESFVLPEDTVLDTTQLESLLANDSDPEGQALSLRVLQPPARGTLTQLPGGHVRYVPQRDDTGIVHFDYVVHDGELDSLPARVQIQLMSVNDPPQANPDVYQLPANEPVLIRDTSQGLLANDVDPDGDTLVATVTTPPASGVLQLSLDGSFSYTPAMPRPASVSFVYRVRDPAGLESSATVTIVLGGTPADELFRNGFEEPR